MTKKAATTIGYKRVVDYKRSRNKFLLNTAVVEHATAELKPSKRVFDYKTILLANFSFLIRVISYHVILVALATNTVMQIYGLIIVELVYIGLIVKNFIVLKYLISAHLFISKLTQAVFLLVFHIISLLIFFQHGPNSQTPPSKSMQNTGMWCLLISVAFEYIFLIVNVVWIGKQLLKKRKLEKSKPKSDNEAREEILLYKWVLAENQAHKKKSGNRVKPLGSKVLVSSKQRGLVSEALGVSRGRKGFKELKRNQHGIKKETGKNKLH
jgi:hypothetical protein